MEEQNNKETAQGATSGAEAENKAQNSQVFSIPSTREIVELEKDTLHHLHRLVYVFERLQLSEYISMLQNPRRLIMMNFLAGVSRGFGIVIGMTVLVALFLYFLGSLVDAPVVGQYIAKFVQIVQDELRGAGRGF